MISLIKQTNLQHTDARKDDALILAIQGGYSYEIIKPLLSNHAYSIEAMLVLAMRHQLNENIIKNIFKKIKNFHYQNNDQQTLLMSAIIYGYSLDIINIFIKVNDINHQDINGNTALMLAIFFRASYNIIQILIEMGTTVTLKDKKGETALALAESQNRKTIINILNLHSSIDTFVKKWTSSFIEQSYTAENRNSIPRINPLLHLFENRARISDRRSRQLTVLSQAINTLHFTKKAPSILKLFKTIGYIKAELKKKHNCLGTRLNRILSKIQNDLNQISLIACLSQTKISVATQKGAAEYKQEYIQSKARKKNFGF